MGIGNILCGIRVNNKGVVEFHCKPPLYKTQEELDAANRKIRMDAIAEMDKGDNTVKTQEYYDEFFKEIDNTRYSSGESYFNPRTGAQISVLPQTSLKLVDVKKGGLNEREQMTLFDWGKIGLIRAIRTNKGINDGAAYCNKNNSKLQRFDAKTGEWKDLAWTKTDALDYALLRQNKKEVRE